MRRGFTLIEALVSAVLLGVGVVASLHALATLNRNEVAVRKSEQINRVAQQKLDELIATEQLINAPIDGTFEENGLPNLEWTLETEPSEVEGLLVVRLRVYDSGKESNSGITVSTLQFDVAQTSGATAP